MSWLSRIFGKEEENKAKQSSSRSAATATQSARPQSQSQSKQESIPAERMGLNGEYDQSGLAKRVAKAFDDAPDLDDIETLWVAQTGSTVVLKGKVPNRQLLDKMVTTARRVKGATDVDTNQVEIAA